MPVTYLDDIMTSTFLTSSPDWSPSCPLTLLPQAYTEPADVSNKEW